MLEVLKSLKQGTKRQIEEPKKRGRSSNNSAAAEIDAQPPNKRSRGSAARETDMGVAQSSRSRSRSSQKRKAAQQDAEEEDEEEDEEEEGESGEEEEDEESEDGTTDFV